MPPKQSYRVRAEHIPEWSYPRDRFPFGFRHSWVSRALLPDILLPPPARPWSLQIGDGLQLQTVHSPRRGVHSEGCCVPNLHHLLLQEGQEARPPAAAPSTSCRANASPVPQLPAAGPPRGPHGPASLSVYFQNPDPHTHPRCPGPAEPPSLQGQQQPCSEHSRG